VSAMHEIRPPYAPGKWAIRWLVLMTTLTVLLMFIQIFRTGTL
jgi:hypothetical protein